MTNCCPSNLPWFAFSQEMLTSSVEVIGKLGLALHFSRDPLKKFSLGCEWLLMKHCGYCASQIIDALREKDIHWTWNYTACEVYVWEVEACLFVPAATTRWHHGSGNKVQNSPRTVNVLSALEVLLQTQNMVWICKPFSEPRSSFPQM